MNNGLIHLADNLKFLKLIEDNSIDLIYLDPPFNTGKEQRRISIESIRDENGNVGFGGNKYKNEIIDSMGYGDNIRNYYLFLWPVIDNCHRILKNTGSIFLHLNWHEIHTGRRILDQIFRQENFRNEIIWAWDYGAKSKDYWPRKHDNILWYTKTDDYYFDIQQSDRLPYMAPELVGAEKAERGKLPTDVWFVSIVGTNSKEKTGYPNQKPVKLLERLMLTTSKENDLVLDPFAGSGSWGATAEKHNRDYILIDNNPDAVKVMKERLPNAKVFDNSNL